MRGGYRHRDRINTTCQAEKALRLVPASVTNITNGNELAQYREAISYEVCILLLDHANAVNILDVDLNDVQEKELNSNAEAARLLFGHSS